MGNYKRNTRYAGKPELLDPIERAYKSIWLQPMDERQVPMEVYVYEKQDGWHGYRATDDRARMPEVFWIRGLWKQVPSPLPVVAHDVEIRDVEYPQDIHEIADAMLKHELEPLSDDNEEETMEVNPE